MVKLATQLIERQTGKYDPADVEDRYEARLRDVIDAKLKGEGIQPMDEEEPDRGNVIDLMAALRQSLGSEQRAREKIRRAKKRGGAEEKRRQTRSQTISSPEAGLTPLRPASASGGRGVFLQGKPRTRPDQLTRDARFLRRRNRIRDTGSAIG